MKIEYGDFPDWKVLNGRGKYAPLLKDFLSSHEEPMMRLECSDIKSMNLCACSLRQTASRLNASVRVSSNSKDLSVYVEKIG